MAEGKGKLILGGVELGGTTTVVSIAEGHPTNVKFTYEFDTIDPKNTINQAAKLLKDHKVDTIGIASFGPVDLDLKSKTYGYITTTPKKGWGNADVLSPIKALGKPTTIDTDVNAAAIGELVHGKHGGKDGIGSCCYVTVGTGIGVGVVVHGKTAYGVSHPEGGHFMPRKIEGEQYKGNCPYHGDCVEGLANAKAIADRTGLADHRAVKTLSNDHPVWDIEAFYMAQLCVVLASVVSPDVIVLGGGIHRNDALIPKIRQKFKQIINGYLSQPKFTSDVDSYIVRSIFDEKDAAKEAATKTHIISLDDKLNWKLRISQGPKTTPGAVGSLELAAQAFKRSKL